MPVVDKVQIAAYVPKQKKERIERLAKLDRGYSISRTMEELIDRHLGELEDELTKRASQHPIQPSPRSPRKH